MNRILTGTSVALAAVLLIAGCQHRDDPDRVRERTAETEYDAVVFTDYDLRRTERRRIFSDKVTYRFTVEDHGKRKTETGTTEVWARLRNHTDYDYQVQARTVFFDENRAPEDTTAWQRFSVPANSLSDYRERSTTTKPLLYRVEVREAK